MRQYHALLRITPALLACWLLSTTCRDSRNPQEPAGSPAPLQPTVTVPSPPVVLLAAGDIARCDRTGDEATAALLDLLPTGTVVALGDAAYPAGADTDYTQCYDPSWGRHKARTRPVPGALDYRTTGATGYFGYFGAAAGEPGKGYYSYDVGDWHIVALNSGIDMSLGSPQEQWLAADLAASTKLCTLAYFHLPRFYSAAGTDTVPRSKVKQVWTDLYAANAEIVLGAHTRNYERFAPQTPDAVRDSARGLRQFVVGTGGIGPWPFGSYVAPNSEVRAQVNGVLELTLSADSYAWQFVPVAGTVFADTGSSRCHGGSAPIAKPGGPYAAEGPITFDGSASFSPTGAVPLSYSWTFGDGATGSGATPSHTYATMGTYTVTLVVTDSRGVTSAPATTTATFANFPPTVTIAPARENQLGDPFTLPVTFRDPGTDGPWTYRVTWGDASSATSGSVTTQTPLTFTHRYAARGTYAIHVSVTDARGAEGVADAAVVVRTVFVGAGDIADCGTTGASFTSALLDSIPGVVFAAGDNAYPDGSSSDYATCYEPTWGRHKARTRPVPGNHEYETDPTASGYFGYFGAAAGERGKGYYSYDLGDWHIVAINSEIDISAGSTEVQWLRSDLAASGKRCTLAIWHEPRFVSGTIHLSNPKYQSLWDTLYRYGAELVVNAHKHGYERFAPQSPAAAADPTFGIREIIAGTGGGFLDGGDPVPEVNSQVRNAATWGVLKLTLNPDSYSWRFVPIAGATFTDSGTTACHDAPAPPTSNRAPTAVPGGPYTGLEGGATRFDGGGSSDPDGDALTYAWSFGDGSTGSGVAPTHTYADNGSYAVTLTVTDARGASSSAAATSATISNVAPSVSAGADQTVTAGTPFTLDATFADPGANDAPWAYTIGWGDGSETRGTTSSRSSPITATHTYAAPGAATVGLTVTDKDGGGGSGTLAVTVTAPTAPSATLVGAGNIASCDATGDEGTADLLDRIAGTVFAAGDNAYDKGRRSQYNGCYEPSWGRHKARTAPAPGERDYLTAGGNAYFEYFGAAAGDPAKGYYSYDLGAWHVIVLNSGTARVSTAAGSAQEQWLRADLGAHPGRCTLAYWHHPLFASKDAPNTAVLPLWNALYAAGADVVVNAHYGFYERFAPQTPAGAADPVRGIREFIAGTGGAETTSFGAAGPNSEVRLSGTFGVLKLTLGDGTYAWEFIPVAGQTATDSGSGSCH